MVKLYEMLVFRRMIAPVILQVLFWAAIAGTLFGTYVLIRLDHWAWWIALIFGVLTTRVIFEVALLLFRSYERLTEIRNLLEKTLSE